MAITKTGSSSFLFLKKKISYVLMILGNTSMEKVTSGSTAELDFAHIASQSNGSCTGSRWNIEGKQIYLII